MNGMINAMMAYDQRSERQSAPPPFIAAFAAFLDKLRFALLLQATRGLGSSRDQLRLSSMQLKRKPRKNGALPTG
jgi:hypothetical protein